MEQTPQNTFDYDSCRRVWQRVSPELDPYPAGEGSAGCPAAPAPDLKRLQEFIEGELGDRRAYLCAARCAPHPAARRGYPKTVWIFPVSRTLFATRSCK